MPVNSTINETVQAIINHTAPIKLQVTPMPTPLPAGVTTTALDWAPIPLPPFNIPIWAILGVLSFAALVIVILHWYDMSGNLDAIKPWFIKAKEIKLGKMQVVRLSRAGNFIPDCLNIFDNILSYGESDENINQWHLNSPLGIVRVGGIMAAIVSEDWDQNRDIVTEIAICEAADNLNTNIEALRAELSERHKKLIVQGVYPADAPNPATLIRPIQSGLDYLGKADENSKEKPEVSGRRVLQLLYPEGIRIRAFNLYAQSKFRKFWFRGNTSALFGGENIRRVEDEFVKKSDVQPGFFQRYGAMLIGAMVFLGCIIAGAAIPL
ncbi:MAG: hypothetical protein M0Q91_05170 [Methanoregula sp.]|jgi:hypothetical protein|nr:hypothetical protein [Methanoregula sp.]